MTMPEYQAVLDQLARLQLEIKGLSRKVEEALHPPRQPLTPVGCPTDYSTTKEER